MFIDHLWAFGAELQDEQRRVWSLSGSLFRLFVVDLASHWRGYNPTWRIWCPSQCYLWPLSCFGGCFLNIPLSQSNRQLSRYANSLKWVKSSLPTVMSLIFNDGSCWSCSFVGILCCFLDSIGHLEPHLVWLFNFDSKMYFTWCHFIDE